MNTPQTLLVKAVGWPVVAAISVLVPASFAAAQTPTITNLGVLPGGTASYANAVSADGLAVAGMSGSSDGDRAFRWTAADGIQSLQVLPGGLYSTGSAISGDGAIVAGTSGSSAGARAFRWTASSGMQNLGVLPAGGELGSLSVGALSYDGLTVVGDSEGHAFRWTSSGGVQWIATPGSTGGKFPTFFSYSTTRISGDSSTIAVVTYYLPWDGEPFLSCTLSSSKGPSYYTLGAHLANAVNINGTRAAGTVNDSPWWDPQPARAFRWVAGEGTQELVSLSGASASAGIAISGNGLFVAGLAEYPGSNQRAFYWNAELGMVDLNTYLPSLGVNVTGWVLVSANGLNYDGSVIVGNGTYQGQTRAWIVRIPRPGDITGDGYVNIDDLVQVLTLWGACPAFPSPCAADITPFPNGNGAVNIDDLVTVITHWG